MKQLIKRYPVLTFFVLIIALGWIAVIVGTAVMPIDAEHEMTVAHVLFVFFIASPSVVGILLTVVVDGREELKALFSRVVRWRVNPSWYLAGLLVIPAIYGLGYLFQGLLGGPLAPINVVEKLGFGIPIALTASLMEEFGWHGFALPRLQRRYSALVSALFVGLGVGLGGSGGRLPAGTRLWSADGRCLRGAMACGRNRHRLCLCRAIRFRNGVSAIPLCPST